MLEPELYVMGASGGVYALLISQLANILLVSKDTYVTKVIACGVYLSFVTALPAEPTPTP
jgi:hypothetical protein